MGQIKHIILDFHDVLMDKDLSRTIAAFEQLAGQRVDAVVGGEDFRTLLFQFELGNTSESGFLAALRRFSSKPIATEALVRGWNRMLLEIPASRIEYLRGLRAKYRLYLLSNSNPIHHRHALEHLRDRHGIADFDRDFFERTYYSYLLRKVKPDPEIFTHVLRDAGIDPDEALFVDDDADNVAAARRLGIHAVHHPRGRDIADTLDRYLGSESVDLLGRFDEHRIHDVIIVGAGLSGLAAADTLRAHGVGYVLLDAADRPGGRVLTAGATERGFVDMGGGYVGGTQYFIQKYIDRYGLGTIDTYLDTRKQWVYQRPDGSLVRFPGDNPLALPGGEETIAALGLWNDIALNIRANIDDPSRAINAEQLDAITAEDWLREYQRRHRTGNDTLDIARLSVNALMSTEPDKVSMLFLQYYAATAGDYAEIINVNGGPDSDNNSWSPEGRRLTYGAGDLVWRMIADVGPEHIFYGAQVASIRHDGGLALVNVHDAQTGRDQQLRARRVIVAMSPVMARQIDTPDLADMPGGADRIALAARMFMGRTNKGFLAYKRPFWRARGLMGYTLSAGRYDRYPLSWTLDHSWEPVPPTNVQVPAVRHPYSLMTFVIGEAAEHWAAREFGERREAIVRQLVEIYGPQARSELISGEYYVEKDWHLDAYTQGGPSALMPPNTLTRHGGALRRPVGNIHWAGTESATNWCGYMDGAIQAGERAASEVIRALGRGHDIFGARPVG